MRGEASEILRNGQMLVDRIGRIEERLERDRGRLLAGLDHLSGRLEDLPVQRIEEVHRLQERRDAVHGLVVDQDRTEERLLGLDVVGNFAELLGIGRGRSVAQLVGLEECGVCHARNSKPAPRVALDRSPLSPRYPHAVNLRLV